MFFVVVRENKDEPDPVNRDVPINVYRNCEDAEYMARQGKGYRVVPVVPVEDSLAILPPV